MARSGYFWKGSVMNEMVILRMNEGSLSPGISHVGVRAMPSNPVVKSTVQWFLMKFGFFELSKIFSYIALDWYNNLYSEESGEGLFQVF